MTIKAASRSSLELMTPSQPPAKRKAEDTNLLKATAKRTRKDNAASNKRKLLNGEEQPGGLVIIRSAPSRPLSPLGTRPPSSQLTAPQPEASTSRAQSSQPANKKFKASSSARLPASTNYERADVDDVDEQVRRMESETRDLRQKSRSDGSSNSLDADLHQLSRSSQPRASSRQPSHKDTSVPLAPRETPQIEKNKQMRGEGGQGHSRRSSLSMRGKRTSSTFENTGIITQPHSSVEETSFYKHIDCDLPESSRARQLLIWCAARTESVEASSSSLSPIGAELVKGVRDDVVKMLAEKRIDTNVLTPAGSDAGARRTVEENEQNVKNRARKVKFTADIERAAAEDEAWTEVERFYKAHQTAALSELEQRRKAKGKDREVGHDDWGPREAELPDHLRPGVDLARSVLAEDLADQSALRKRWSDLPYNIDELHSLVNTSLQTASVATTDLDRRFALLSLTLQARSQSHPPHSHASLSASTPLAAYLPTPAPTTDPQEIFRALSRVDMARPAGQVGDAAFRAVREVQRAQAGEGTSERRLTGVAPPTPRKPPGTPRRGATPGKGR